MKQHTIRRAAHYIFAGQPFRLSYAVMDETGHCQAVAPLTEEIAATSFTNGLLLLIPDEMESRWKTLQPLLAANPPASYPALIEWLQHEMSYLFSPGMHCRVVQWEVGNSDK